MGKVHVGTVRFVLFWALAHLVAFGAAGALDRPTCMALGAGFAAGLALGLVGLLPALKPAHVAKLEHEESQVIGTRVPSGVDPTRLLGRDVRSRDAERDWW
jgi:hypothetical protein